MNRTLRIERARSTCDVAERLKPKLPEPFDRVVLQNTANEVRQTIRRGELADIEAQAARLQELINAHHKELSHAAA